MSLAFVQLGQCGNQMGDAFYSFLEKECLQAFPSSQAVALDTFFFQNQQTEKLTAQALTIDMEPKVVNKCLLNHKNDIWSYDQEFSYVNQQGSGNNWAYGFNYHGPNSRDDIMKKAHSLLEQLDFCEGFIFLHSLAGGTGSGLGSYLLKEMSDQFPEMNMMNICVVPHLTGEVILQSYNSVLTIASLYEDSRGIILVENDLIGQICHDLLHLKKPTLDEMNTVIAHQLNSLFYPAIDSQKTPSLYSPLQNNFRYFTDMIETLLLDPQYQLLSIRNVPQMPDSSQVFNNDQWGALQKRISQMLVANSCESRVNWSVKPGVSANAVKSIGNLLIARGTDSNQQNFEILANKEYYKDERVVYQSIIDSNSFNQSDRSITLLSNSSFCSEPLDLIGQRANQMFQENAYLYQYEKYGISKDDMLESLAIFEQISNNYNFK